MKKYVVLFVLIAVLVISMVALAEDTKPTLTLSVSVNNSSTLNVTYVAKLSPVPSTPGTVIKIDFYTGSPLLPVFPTQYVGSAPIDNTGVAKISFHQNQGEYVGGAIWDSSIYGKIYSNIVKYKVP